jgi:hypothetical protein
LSREFFASLRDRALPTPAEASDNLVNLIGEQAEGSPGARMRVADSDSSLLGKIGVIGPQDLDWAVNSLRSRGLLNGSFGVGWADVNLTADGWERYEELKRAHVSSRFAFFARKFENPDLDAVFDHCLRPAVQATGYELRTVTQRAGLVDAYH